MRSRHVTVGFVIAVLCALAVWELASGPGRDKEEVSSLRAGGSKGAGLTVTYPLDGTLFPPEIVAPTFRWQDGHPESDAWVVTLRFDDDEGPLKVVTGAPTWRPSRGQWETIKRRSLEEPAEVTIQGIRRAMPGQVLSEGRVEISTSQDEVGDSIFYREVILPFMDAVVDPSRIRWRYGAISSETQPPVVLGNLPVCGNCHSFSADGNVLGMEVDSGNDKGAYAVVPVEEETVLAKEKIISWGDYKRSPDEPTFGLLCQVSPDGKYVVGTVKDQALAIYTPDLMFSQLFFLIKGIMCIHDREEKRFFALPGADDKAFVHTNATWSPDGKHIVFARSKAHDLDVFRRQKRALIGDKEAEAFVERIGTYRYDLYRIPFNEGRGGVAEPLAGASHNGKSNYFAKYSPDGKWIVFCKARSFMLLQPDSELYIIPAEGGEARRMHCNTARMNSWHSWSSNSRWLVFSSKVNSAYTQLFLTHVDEQGNDTPPVLLEQFTSPDRAANIPEFVPRRPDAIQVIRERYVDDLSYVRAGEAFGMGEDYEGAVGALRKAVALNPRSAEAHGQLGFALFKLGRLEEAIVHYEKALALDPRDDRAHNGLGFVKSRQGKLDEAEKHFREALRLNPQHWLAHGGLADVLKRLGRHREAALHSAEAERLRQRAGGG